MPSVRLNERRSSPVAKRGRCSRVKESRRCVRCNRLRLKTNLNHPSSLLAILFETSSPQRVRQRHDPIASVYASMSHPYNRRTRSIRSHQIPLGSANPSLRCNHQRLAWHPLRSRRQRVCFRKNSTASNHHINTPGTSKVSGKISQVFLQASCITPSSSGNGHGTTRRAGYKHKNRPDLFEPRLLVANHGRSTRDAAIVAT